MRLFSENEYQELFEVAQNSELLRAHLLLHSSHDEKVQRLLIALVKGSFVLPHYHELEHQWEMFVVLSGQLNVKTYDQDNRVITERICTTGEIIEFLPKEIHSVECISDKSLLLEIKEGPFNPKFAKVMAV